MSWPLSQDYNEAIQSPLSSFNDPELKQGEAKTNAIGLPMPRSGNFADVYEFSCPATNRKWAIKCFTREVPGLRERYSEISAYLQQVKLPFMVDFNYLDQGIKVRGQWFPVLKMHWVEGFTLNEFVNKNADQPATLELLGQIWLRLARRLREAKMAHCDLQHGNVLLVPGSTAKSLAVKLIDYDGMFVPALAQAKSGEVGHPAYQHPQRLREGIYSVEVDRFPHLVIYTALRSLMVGSRYLWNKHDNGDNLLFKQADLDAPEQSPLFAELMKLNDPEVRKLVQALSQAAGKPLEQTPLLEELAAASPATSPKRKSAVVPAPAAEPTVESMFAQATTGTGERSPSAKKSYVRAALGGAVALIGLVVGGLMLAMNGKPKESGPEVAELPPPASTSKRMETSKAESRKGPEPRTNPDPSADSAGTVMPEEQVKAVIAKLRERNPGFDGKDEHNIVDGVVTGLKINTEHVTDLAPVRALSELQHLTCSGGGDDRIGTLADLTPLAGMKLKTLSCFCNPITDLTPLTGMPLTSLNCWKTQVADLKPLAGMPLTWLVISGTQVTDLSPLRGMHLKTFYCGSNRITDLSPLQGMPLEELRIGWTSVSDLTPLKGMSLKQLQMQNLPISDLTLLKGMPLVEFNFSVKPEHDLAIVRSIKTLQTINNKPAAEFWKELDAKVVKNNPNSKVQRAPQPDDKVQAQARKAIKDRFKEDYARRKPTDLLVLADKLLKQAAETKEDPAERFVLYGEARDLAAQAADSAQAIRAVDEMAKEFAINATAMKIAVLEKVNAATKSPETLSSLAETALAAVEEAVAADDYAAAARIFKVADAAARKAKNVPLVTSVQARTKEVESLRKEFEKLKEAVKTLATKPTDPDANLALGKFLCFQKGQWDKGLALLVQGSDAKLQALAEKDQRKPPNVNEQIQLGDEWLTVAAAYSGPVKAHMQWRAAHWYVNAYPRLTGESKPQAEKVLKRLPLTYLVDLPESDYVRGPWDLGKGMTGATDEQYKKPITINGVPSPHGLGMHPGMISLFTSVKYKLGGTSKRFQGAVGLNDSTTGSGGPVTFQIWGDGRHLWASIPRRGPRQTQDFGVNVVGVQVLELRVTAQEKAGGAHGAWIEPHLLK